MGVDAHLYLNTRWGLDDIVKVIKRTENTTVEIKSHHDFAPGYFTLNFNDRMLHLHTYTQTPIGTSTLLSLGSNADAIRIFKGIAEVLGGVLMPEDTNGQCELIDGNMDEDNALPYFLKHAVLEDGIDPDDIDELVKSKEDWHKKYKM